MKNLKCWLRVCAVCSSGWGPQDLLCEACWQRLWQKEKLRRGYFVTAHFPVSTLWSWTSSDIVESLIRAQKTVGLELARERIVRRLLAHPLGATPAQIVYVTPQEKSEDHASEGATVLAKFLGVPVFGFKMQTGEDYKSKGRKERQQTRSIVREAQPRMKKPIWFYDDVITTGTTARAVWEVLGKPQHFQAVALAYREHRGRP